MYMAVSLKSVLSINKHLHRTIFQRESSPRRSKRLVFSLLSTLTSDGLTPSSAASISKVEDIFDIELPTNENNPNLLRIRHSAAHVMAMAVQKVYPDARVTIGPWIDNG